MMETEVHARNWSFVIAPSSTVITNLFRKATSAINWPHDLYHKTCKCNSNFAGYDCSKCEFGYYVKVWAQKKTLTRKNFLKWSAEEKDQYMRYINMSRYYISNYVVTLTPCEEINKTVMANLTQQHSFTTSATMTCSCGSTTMLYEAPFSHITWLGEILTLRMTGRGFLRGIDCIIQ